VDPLTHGLASLAVQRGFFPRSSWRGVLAIIVAGVIADLDWFSASFGPSAYLRWHRSATHSLVFVAALTLAAFLFSRSIRRTQNASSQIANPPPPSNLSTQGNLPVQGKFPWIAVAVSASLHILMDLLQADSVAPLWPFSTTRFALDILPRIDPWLLIILAAAILFPELLRLVTEEIGSRSKRPRGRNGAIIGLALAIIYFAMRALFHTGVTSSLEARTISGEMPRRAGAFPNSASPFLWHCIVETESALHLVNLRTMGGEITYATGITTLRKPGPSPFLTAAQASPAAIEFLRVARFPKAVLQKETEGYSVDIQDLKDQVTQSQGRTISVDINLDPSAKVVSSELQWQKSSTRP
jgi:membrane-bound metal-dependent hydrolase YbcI (DUF457 family)